MGMAAGTSTIAITTAKFPLQRSVINIRILATGLVCIVASVIFVVYQIQTARLIRIHVSDIASSSSSSSTSKSRQNFDSNQNIERDSSKRGIKRDLKCDCDCEAYCGSKKANVFLNGTKMWPFQVSSINNSSRNLNNTDTGGKGEVEHIFEIKFQSESQNSTAAVAGGKGSISKSSQSRVKKVKKVKNIFILTTWRSGSSFFGEVLSSHPDIFYHFEPLMYFDYQEIMSGPQLTEALWTLKNLSECNYSAVEKYMTRNRVGWNLLSLNNKISQECAALHDHDHDDCFNTTFLQKRCRQFPVQLFKLTRLRGSGAEELLRQFQNVQIIYLVRDPRAIYSSRMKVGWCPLTTSCGQINLLCKSLQEDLVEITKLQSQSKYSSVIQVIKYEHIALEPTRNFQKIFSHLQIPWDEATQEHIKAHTSNTDTKDPMSTVKVSPLHVERWRGSLALETIGRIERHCHDFMLELGYTFIHPDYRNKTKDTQ